MSKIVTKIKCIECNGDGLEQDGSGGYGGYEYIKCTRCGGEGMIECPPRVECERCEGTGEVHHAPNGKTVKCSNCLGAGYINVPAEPEPVDDVVEGASFFQGDLVRKKCNGELCIVQMISRTKAVDGSRFFSYSLINSNGIVNAWYEYDDLELVDIRRKDLWDKWQK